MANLKTYSSFLNLGSHPAILEAFCDSLLPTNRTYDFFVDWDKVQANLAQYRIEIGILGTLTRSKDFRQDLKAILLEYPRTAQILPLLIAVRDRRFEVLEDLEKAGTESFDFTQTPTERSVPKLLRFVEQSGIASELFGHIRVLQDYLYGVEAGLDTNARKNRSGSFMEKVVQQALEGIQGVVNGVEMFPKGAFRHLAQHHGVPLPETLRERTPDFSIRKGKHLLSLEVNFYSGVGSKPQEIVDAYINRQRELKGSGWQFAWITDGNGWRRGQNQIAKAIEHMDYVMNLSFVKRGFLEAVIKQL